MEKKRVFVSLFVFMIGFFPLLNSLGNPRLGALHGSDIVRLMASGFCFGVAFGVLVGGRKFS